MQGDGWFMNKGTSRTLLPSLNEYEQELTTKLGLGLADRLTGPIISIGGFAGVGKDTLAIGLREKLADQYGLDLNIYNAGDFIRQYAVKKGYKEQHLDEFLQAIREDENFAREVDFFVDRRTLELGLEKQQGIFIGRMAPFALGSWGVSIFIFVRPKERARRVVQDPERKEYGMMVDEVLERMERRDLNDRLRLRKIYNIHFNSLIDHLDIQIDNSKNTIVETVDSAFEQFQTISKERFTNFPPH